jgi:DnaK suppressor protein
MAAEKTQYSEAELKEFEQLIHQKLEEARIDYNLLKNSLSLSDNHGTDDTGRTFNMMEDGITEIKIL